MTSSRISWVQEEHAEGVIIHAKISGDKALNLVDQSILETMTCELEKILKFDNLRCVFLSGCTDKAFIGGANLKSLNALEITTAEKFISSIHEFCETIQRARVPIIAVLKGYCLGAGLEIAAACDFRIGNSSVFCGMPEVRVGVPSVVEAVLLPELVGWGKAKELMLRGNIIDAKECERIGLIEHLEDDDKLDLLLKDIIADILSGGPEAIASQKLLFRDWKGSQYDKAIRSGVAAFVKAYETEEPKIKINNFFNN
jgi:enoyl-CoA hydratase/carnithine racemase